MTTIHQLRTRLETAWAEYLSANIEHPTAVLIAKDELTNACFDYWAACADLVTRLPDDIEALQKDAEVGRIALKFFDRMDDPTERDPLENSVSELLAEVGSIISRDILCKSST